jgi:hypothetical protein
MKYLLCLQALNHVTTTNKKYEVIAEDDHWWTIRADDGLVMYIFKGSCPNWQEQSS